MRAIRRLILVILVFAASIDSSYAQRKEALIINQSATTETSILFYYTDILAKDKQKSIKPGDTLHVVFDENSFDQITVRIAREHYRVRVKKPALLVWPGDVVTVRYVEATDTYTFSGKQAAELKFYDCIRHNAVSLDSWAYETFLGDLPPTLDELMCQWQDERRLTDGLLAELRNTPGVRPMVVAALTRELQLQAFLFLLRGNSYQELYYATSTYVPSSLRQYKFPGAVKMFPAVYQDSVLAQFRRLRYLQALPLSVSERRSYVATDFMEYLALAQGKPATYGALYALAKREYTGNQKEWTCYWLLYNAKRIRRPQPHLVKDYRSWMMPESRFVRSLTGQDQLTLVMPDQQLANTDTLISPSGQKTTLAQLLAKHRGKMIYLDFWASWCLPCLMEMPASAALRQHYSGKPVAFIYVSIDEDALKWQRATKQHLPKNVEQYRFANYKTARFVKRFGITSIPRHILLDKYGIMRYAEAPRPDDPELKTHIATFLAR
ncbi:TlpA family protein disulfide reductase [Hymenobacter volaticus]|uniref:TlpA family protein disulfide reductase n=1 Tax=Hymenobacter volaticus TaxID=2932254 RepID=A0ABY4G4J1_9BACT|nr:TlpA disulfide reductase family protein [Hymenobacter volaticus]UOQ65733.1 TlpA family protein disulfide reductase [Hymenobacter volaticus]